MVNPSVHPSWKKSLTIHFFHPNNFPYSGAITSPRSTAGAGGASLSEALAISGALKFTVEGAPQHGDRHLRSKESGAPGGAGARAPMAFDLWGELGQGFKQQFLWGNNSN